jgi:D-amino peptidase
MKAYISADIEGVTGIVHWDECEADKGAYGEFRERMTAEVAAVCEGAQSGGAGELWVQDAHDNARNILHERLPAGVRLVRGWSGDPRMMIQELDASFGALLLVGWHASTGTGGTPLAHSMSTRLVDLELNGEPASELLLHGWAAAELGVPTVLVTGDEWICEQAGRLFPGVETVAVHRGRGGSVIARHPAEIRGQLREAARRALQAAPALRPVELPGSYELRLRYRRVEDAFKNGFFPGARHEGAHGLRLHADSMAELLRALLFLL